MGASDWISVLALFVATFAAWHSVAQGRTQQKLNKALLSDRDDAAVAASKSELTAEAVGNPRNGYRVEITNTGKSAARNIHISFDPDKRTQLFDDEDLAEATPHRFLLPGRMFHIDASFYMDMALRQHFNLEWDDDSGRRFEAVLVTFTE